MKKFLLFIVVVSIFTSCVSTKAIYLNPDETQKYDPVPWQQVNVYLTEKDVPGEFIKFAIITAEGKEGVTTEQQMINNLKKKAGSIGADAIILESIKDPGSVERAADSLSGGLGLGARKGRAIAIKFKAKEDTQ